MKPGEFTICDCRMAFWCGDRRDGQALKCPLRRQATSQRDIVHPPRRKITDVLGGWMRNGWTWGRVQLRPGRAGSPPPISNGFR